MHPSLPLLCQRLFFRFLKDPLSDELDELLELELLDELDELFELELLDELDELLELELLDELDELLELELLDEFDELLELELLDELPATRVCCSASSDFAVGSWSRPPGTAAVAAAVPIKAAPASVVTAILKFFMCLSCCVCTVG